LVSKLILVSSSPFEDRYADEIMGTRWKRFDANDRTTFDNLMQHVSGDLHQSDVEESLLRMGKLVLKTDSYDLISDPPPISPNVDVFKLVSQEASELRRSGQLLQLGETILCPVVAIHGDYDPHPYKGVQEPLSRVLKDFRMFLLRDCGHDPWLERAARENFFDILKNELTSLTCS
jgi:pimeloyl-ACP methyl ester carboxylesterase